MSVYNEPEPYAQLATGQTRRERFAGHMLTYTALAETGIHSGRRRFRVFCETCNVEVHEATTGPQHQADSHLRDVEDRLRAALTEALDAIEGGREPIALAESRIAELRKLVMP